MHTIITEGEKMVLTGLNITAITIYVGWNSHIISDRIKKDDNSFSFLTMSEIIYTLIMLYLLITLSAWFAFLTILVAICHVVIGSYVELFKPHIASSEIMNKFWSYLTIDVAISMLSYLLLNSGL